MRSLTDLSGHIPRLYPRQKYLLTICEGLGSEKTIKSYVTTSVRCWVLRGSPGCSDILGPQTYALWMADSRNGSKKTVLFLKAAMFRAKVYKKRAITPTQKLTRTNWFATSTRCTTSPTMSSTRLPIGKSLIRASPKFTIVQAQGRKRVPDLVT